MKKRKKEFPVWLGIATTWFDMHCGSGFATGSIFNVYYAQYGWTAIFYPFITWALLAVIMYVFFEYNRLIKATNYKDFAKSFFIPKIGFLFVLFYDLYAMLGQGLGTAGALAGGGELIVTWIEGNYWVGLIVVAVVIFLCVVFGQDLMMRANSVFTFILAGLIIAIGIASVVMNWGNFSSVILERQQPEGTAVDAFKGAINYVGVQIGVQVATAGMASSLLSRRDSAKAAGTGFLLNSVLMWMLGLVLISFYPNISGEALPVLAGLKIMDADVLVVLYVIMLFLRLYIHRYRMLLDNDLSLESLHREIFKGKENTSKYDRCRHFYGNLYFLRTVGIAGACTERL